MAIHWEMLLVKRVRGKGGGWGVQPHHRICKMFICMLSVCMWFSHYTQMHSTTQQ